MRPDWVLSPATQPMLPYHNQLQTLTLRETMIDDNGLFHLIGRNRLRSFTLMSCQGELANACNAPVSDRYPGITASAVTKLGLLRALQQCGPYLEELVLVSGSQSQ
jgi:hypothetical protein